MAHLKIAVSGAHGFIGSKLCESLTTAGYEVWPMVRAKTDDATTIFYDYDNEQIDLDKLSSCFAVIHLAGKNIASGLWTKSFKQELYDSRVKSTKFIAHSLAKLKQGPRVLLNASAIGIYGDQADVKLDEESPSAAGFLAELSVDWERATSAARDAGLRVVNMRFGSVLDPDGGMLKLLIPLFKSGLGGTLGTGKQFFSYVTRDELIAQIHFLLQHDDIRGPVNMVAKMPITNEEFTRALAATFHRKAYCSIPAFLLRLLGEQGKMMLASARVYPKVLLDYQFQFADAHRIEKVLTELLSNDAR